jgi:1A family penicillin-binding protein
MTGGGTAIGGRAVIANRRDGGLWWRVPCALALWMLFAAPIVVAAIALSILRGYAADLPEVPDLDRWRAELPLSSVITAADGTVLAEIPFQDGEVIGHRRWVAYRELPPLLVRALLAAEDLRFFQHRGVDLQAVARAAWTNYRAGRVVEGASTITQQVARALLPEEIGHQQSIRRKVREALVARRIERHYPKERILEVYVNQVFLGAGAYGVRAAARAYFDRSLDQLDTAQVALIAGLAQAPGRADPFVDPAAARRRRDEVLDRMVKAGFLDAAAGRAARERPLGLHPAPVRYGTIAPWYTERVRRDLEESAPDDYARGGLAVDTAVLPVLAHEAEERARRHADTLGRVPPEVGAVLWDHATGYVEATVGGRTWDRSRFDRATQACRQPGSAFKPIVYAAALAANAITPGTPLRDGPIAEYDEENDVHWKPRNSGRAFRGVALAQDALASSLNAPAVDVFDRVGGKRVIATARRLGITTELDDVRPLVLGASCVVPIELAGAFAAFASGGRRAEPVFAVRVRRGDQVLIDRASPYDPSIDPARRLDRIAAVVGERGEEALDPQTAFLISSMLADVVARGTGTGARAIGRPAAGKTGTTNDNSDAWFVGFTARTVAAVWVGHDDPSHHLEGRSRDGAHAALPLWNQLVLLAEGERTPRPVPGDPPAGVLRARVDRETGLLAQPGAGGAADLWFRQGTEPHAVAGGAGDVPVDLSRASREF